MQTSSLEKKNSKILAANKRFVRHEGQSFLVRVQPLGRAILADAEPYPKGGQPVSLFAKTKLSRDLRELVESGTFS